MNHEVNTTYGIRFLTCLESNKLEMLFRFFPRKTSTIYANRASKSISVTRMLKAEAPTTGNFFECSWVMIFGQKNKVLTIKEGKYRAKRLIKIVLEINDELQVEQFLPL